MTNVPFSTNYDIITATDPLYGADRTGATDSTAALQLAINAAFGVCAFVGGTGGVSSTSLVVTSIVTSSGGVTTNFGTIRAGVTVWGPTGSSVVQSGPGGAGTYTMSPAISIPNGTTLWCSNGSNSKLNKKLYIPAGTYTTTAPLYWTGLIGIHVYGAGITTTTISFQGNPAMGNIMTPASGDVTTPTYTPVLMFEGTGYSLLEGISVHTPSANASVSTMIGWLFYQNANTSYCGTNTVMNTSLDNMYVGMLGDQGGGNVDNFIFINCNYTSCGLAGLRAAGANVINWQVYGGSGSICGWLSDYVPGSGLSTNNGAAYSSPSGSISVLSGLSCSANNWDVINASGQQCDVFGGSFEGAPVISVTSVSITGTGPFTVTLNLHTATNMTGSPKITVFGMTPSGYNGQFTGTVVNSTTITYSLASNPGSVTVNGGVYQTNTGSLAVTSGGAMSVHGSAYRGNTNNAFVADGSSVMHITGSANAAQGNSGPGNIFRIHNGFMTFEGGWFQALWATTGSSINTTGTSILSMRNNNWNGGPPSTLFANVNSSSSIREYDQILLTTVASLPAASSIFKGLRGSVIDGAASLAWGATVTAGGSTFYEVVCNGSAWTVAGK